MKTALLLIFENVKPLFLYFDSPMWCYHRGSTEYKYEQID